jgi:predicted Zn-dependent peptidase
MGQLARSELYWNRTEKIENTLKNIDKVTLKDVIRVANAYSYERKGLCNK